MVRVRPYRGADVGLEVAPNHDVDSQKHQRNIALTASESRYPIASEHAFVARCLRRLRQLRKLSCAAAATTYAHHHDPVMPYYLLITALKNRSHCTEGLSGSSLNGEPDQL